ncbi:MAG: hypothetical protein J6B34_00755 [Clostridia bacterium]|nr:hypothetical protein [Clostridia bacterium]
MKKNEEREVGKISLKSWIEITSLVLVLSLFTCVMIFIRLDEAVDKIEVNEGNYAQVFFEGGFSELIGLDKMETQGDVCENSEKSLEEQYSESKGSINIFDKLFKVTE